MYICIYNIKNMQSESNFLKKLFTGRPSRFINSFSSKIFRVHTANELSIRFSISMNIAIYGNNAVVRISQETAMLVTM